uniref:Nucleolar complex protein 2 n=1 Tax=Anthurium amnicola TaxID=1678845 RepID=A0A1D1YI65_9ARAE
MLNQLSRASGVFIPVTSLVLDCLEYRSSSNGHAGLGKACNFSSLLKVPKQLLKSQEFQEECILSALEQLSAHFAQWSYNISFPELATIPLIVLKSFHEKTTAESLRRLVRHLTDQVEQNSDFVQRKRDEVAFSPSDHASAESFLQFEKSSSNAPFIQYLSNIQQKSSSRKLGAR